MAVFSVTNYIFGSTANQALSKTALAYKKGGIYHEINYKELRDCVEHFAKALLELGIKKGENICILSENRPEWVIADLGIMLVGAVTVPIHAAFSEEYIIHIVSETEAKTIIISEDFVEKALVLKERLPSLCRVILFNTLGVKEILENGHPIEDKSRFERFEEQYGVKVHSFSEMLFKGRDLRVPLYGRSFGADDTASLIYTSGTTGMPKGVVLSHRNLVANVQDILYYVPIRLDDVFLSFLPLSHAFERTAGCFSALVSGAAVYFAENPKAIAQSLQEVRPTILVSVPRVYEKFYEKVKEGVASASVVRRHVFWWAIRYLQRDYHYTDDFMVDYGTTVRKVIAHRLIAKKLHKQLGGRLRLAISGGARLNTKIAHFFSLLNISILEGYGTTETSPIIACNLYDNKTIGSVGKPLRSVSVKIADDGEILVKGDNVMQGYYKNTEATKSALTADGWFKTGDIGYLDKAGFLYITGRKKEIIVTSGGKNISPVMLEETLAESPYIEQVMVIGEGKKCITALIVPNFSNLKKVADSYVLGNQEIMAFYEEEIARRLKKFPEYEKVKRFTLIAEPFTIENGFLTPTLKLRRQSILKEYKDEIEKMYQ